MNIIYEKKPGIYTIDNKITTPNMKKIKFRCIWFYISDNLYNKSIKYKKTHRKIELAVWRYLDKIFLNKFNYKTFEISKDKKVINIVNDISNKIYYHPLNEGGIHVSVYCTPEFFKEFKKNFIDYKLKEIDKTYDYHGARYTFLSKNVKNTKFIIQDLNLLIKII